MYVTNKGYVEKLKPCMNINMTLIDNFLYTSSIFVSVCRCYNSETEPLTEL